MITAAIAEAIKAYRILEVDYQSRNDELARVRRIAPYGLRTGLRRYLVARPQDDPTQPIRLYVVENIRAAHVSKEPFERDPGFNLQAFANRSFGVFQYDEEFGEVIWRFGPHAASHARGFEFRPGFRSSRISRMGRFSFVSQPPGISKWLGTSTSGVIRSRCSRHG